MPKWKSSHFKVTEIKRVGTMSMNGMLARRTNTAKKNRLSVYFISSKSRKKNRAKEGRWEWEARTGRAIWRYWTNEATQSGSTTRAKARQKLKQSIQRCQRIHVYNFSYICAHTYSYTKCCFLLHKRNATLSVQPNLKCRSENKIEEWETEKERTRRD